MSEMDYETFRQKVKTTTDISRIACYMAVFVYLLGSVQYLETVQETGVMYYVVGIGVPTLVLSCFVGLLLLVTHHRVNRLKQEFDGGQQ